MNKKAIIFFWTVFAVFVVGKHGCQHDIIAKQLPNLRQEQTELLDLHNKERKSRGLEELKLDEDLCLYAQRHAEHMASKQNLSHSSMSKLQSASGAGRVGENIACGQETEEQVMKSWMGSSGHKRNILSSQYKHVGFGLKKDKEGRIYWCTVFSD